MNGDATHRAEGEPRGHATGGSIRVVDDVASMSAILEGTVNIVVLKRRLCDAVRREADAAVAKPCFRCVATVRPDAKGRAELWSRLGETPRLVEEVHFWVEVLCELTGCALVGVRLARVESAMCPRFHVDKVLVRVVSTFVGDGTEYVGNEDVDRRFLGHATSCACDEVPGLLRPLARVQRAGLGDILLLKGEGWPSYAGRGAVHRSPRASKAAPRLVMTLDPLG